LTTPACSDPEWKVYIILASDGSLYTGITTNVERRFQEHLEGVKGAKFFSGRRPVKVVYLESAHDRSSASKREAAIKALDRSQKLQLVKESAPSGHDHIP
jgi:putative endonuclease